jgi:hypothetical protein
MSLFNKLAQFEKEFSKLYKKYRSLPEDLKRLEKIIALEPLGIGVNFTTIYHSDAVKIVKARLACASLRGRSIRIIYAYHPKNSAVVYIEIYFKGNKKNEDRKRIDEYIKTPASFKLTA